jgi:hypothetical protein
MKKYFVSQDFQGGNFGKYRVYTPREWREQAIEWATMDDNDDLIKLMRKTPLKKVIETISDIWQLGFSEWTPVHQFLCDSINSEPDKFITMLQDEYDLLWDLQPTLEDEEHAFAVQHARDIYDALLGVK